MRRWWLPNERTPVLRELARTPGLMGKDGEELGWGNWQIIGTNLDYTSGVIWILGKNKGQWLKPSTYSRWIKVERVG